MIWIRYSFECIYKYLKKYNYFNKKDFICYYLRLSTKKKPKTKMAFNTRSPGKYPKYYNLTLDLFIFLIGKTFKAVKRLLREAQELKNQTELFFAQPLDVSVYFF